MWQAWERLVLLLGWGRCGWETSEANLEDSAKHQKIHFCNGCSCTNIPLLGWSRILPSKMPTSKAKNVTKLMYCMITTTLINIKYITVSRNDVQKTPFWWPNVLYLHEFSPWPCHLHLIPLVVTYMCWDLCSRCTVCQWLIGIIYGRLEFFHPP